MNDVQKKSHSGQLFYIVNAYLTRIYFGVNWHTCKKVGDIYDTLVQLSGRFETWS